MKRPPATIQCPFCLRKITGVYDSRGRLDGSAVRRRRKCPKCKSKFSTLEKVVWSSRDFARLLKWNGRKKKA